MNKRSLTPGTKDKLENIKIELSSEIGMEYNDEIYKRRRTSRFNRYINSTLGGIMTKGIGELFKKN